MSSFIPLNVYPDSDSEGEADNTQEIQIEEALKLYQRALKLHTDGEWDEAHKAYDELFSSDIFQADSLSGDIDDEQVHARNTSSASSLPLILYLAYKNHGAFKLDKLHAVGGDESTLLSTIHQALEWFSTALGRDAGDPSLWRKSAQLALAIDSSRLARFALESILDHDTVGADTASDALSLVMGGVPNPEEHLASIRLRDVMRKICDTVALSNPRFIKIAKRKIQPKFEKFVNPYPWLPLPEAQKTLGEALGTISDRKQVVAVPTRTWAAAGRAILSHLVPEAAEEAEINTSSVLQISIPTFEGEDLSRDTTPEEPTPPELAGKSELPAASDNDDIAMTDASAGANLSVNGRRRSGSAARKRKSASLGANEGDAGRSRLSKRQRDKKEADAAAAAAAAAAPDSKAKVRQETQDEKLFNTADELFSPLGVHLGTASSLKVKTEATGALVARDDLYLSDFKKILQDWDDDKGNVVLYGDGIQGPDETAQGMAFLDLETNVPSRPILGGDEGLRKWVKLVNSRGCTPKEAAFEWLKALCVRDVHPTGTKRPSIRGILGSGGQSSWIRHNWPDVLRETVTAVAKECEDVLVRFFREHVAALTERGVFLEEDLAVVEWAQTCLEIYLGDLADSERRRSSAELSMADSLTLTVLRERVQRWSMIVADLIDCLPRDQEGQLAEDQLALRYQWASGVFTAFTGAEREFRLYYFEDLRQILENGEICAFEIPNSSIMPEVSALRAGREISKLKTVDFFTDIFNAASDARDPAEVIEVLEAVLEPGIVEPYDENERIALQEISRFLEGSSAMFRLHLWEKLKIAYERIYNRPKVLCCILRCIEVIMNDLKDRSYVESTPDHRYFVLLRALRLVDQLIPIVLGHVSGGMGNVNMAEIDPSGLVDAMKAVGSLLRLLHTYAFWDDAVKNTEAVQSDLHSYRLVVVKFKEMMVRGWCVQYLLYREAVERGMGRDNGWTEGERESALCRLLKDVHDELGVRHYCKLSDHVFLKLMHDELLRFNIREFDHELLQCIHCRFHLMICQSDNWYFYEHKTDAEVLDKATAMQLMPFILHLASRKKILQLAKTDIKGGLDKLYEVVGPPKSINNNKIAHNEHVISVYIRGSIHPLRLFGSIKGEGVLSTVEVGGLYAQVAAKGLYFLLGKCSLYPVRYQKKVGAVKGDELETAVRFFRADLSCMPDKWETWYRLAQSYESQMEEAQTWSADGINTRRSELVGLERRSILCYMMASSLAIKHADIDDEDVRCLIGGMYMDFGTRVYSASRSPMASESFWTDGFDRHYSGRNGEGMYKAKAHAEVSTTNAIRFALVLFQSAVDMGEQDNWKAYYMIGKCMGKLLGLPDIKPTFGPEDILEKYVEAIKYCPEKIGNDHIFEPHHKLVSTACKYVLGELLTPQRACEILEATPFTKRIEPAEDREGFVKYILEVLKKMRTADKPKWHHRMTNRAAQLKYYEQKDIAGARAEFQTLFSNKAAQLSIWRPENERPGRHFVFASQYTMFYVDLLEILDDRATLEVLAKRVRRLANGLFRHADVWTHVMIAYIKVLRRTGEVPDQADEEVFKNVTFEEFHTCSVHLEAYCNLKDTGSGSPTLELLREVYELRRSNGGLAKTPLIDDLLADTYAKLYAELVPQIQKQLTNPPTGTTTPVVITAAQQLEQENSRANPMSLKNLMLSEDPTPTDAALTAAHNKPDDLPLRGKITKLSRRELVSRAAMICKIASTPIQGKGAPTAGGSGASSVAANPSSPKRGVASGGQERGGSPEDTPMGSPRAERDGDSDEGMESEGDGGCGPID
ncbi:hypothetical protein DFP73DRAFT_516695 [Morchella snyderi]|nr:hypothetical protein DFP73DRAFT_516695 [Morchella snyderi]